MLEDKESESEKNWYVLHTYSGHENKVVENLKHRVKSLGLEDHVFNILVPREKRVQIKKGERQVTDEKMYPGYVLVEMIVNDRSWYVVRNTPGVTGFLGTGATPVAVSLEEFNLIESKIKEEEPSFDIDLEIGTLVEIMDSTFKGFSGKVSEIDPEKGKVRVMIDVFGRETPVEVDTLQVKKI
jgi:transcription termination/antitermination protein NusG